MEIYLKDSWRQPRLVHLGRLQGRFMKSAVNIEGICEGKWEVLKLEAWKYLSGKLGFKDVWKSEVRGDENLTTRQRKADTITTTLTITTTRTQ
jgi:hypothetical protein